MTKNDMEVKEADKKTEQERRTKNEGLKIAGITYGEKELVACMETVIRMHMEGQGI